MDISKQKCVKIPFTGATPVNATEELEQSEKSANPSIISATELIKDGGVTAEPQMAPKNEDVSIAGVTTIAPNSVPDALVYKYNRYCDRIYERIGNILKQSYDPVSVRLSTSITHKTVKKTTQKRKQKSTHEIGRSHEGSVNENEPKARTDCVESNQSKECSVAVKSHPKLQSNSYPSAAASSSAGSHKLRQGGQHQHQHPHQHHKTTVLRRKVNNVVKKQPAKSTPVTPKPQQQVINRARGTLHGLSTIKRHGNVRVTPMTDYLSVRSNFVLGPLVLKVEKSFGRGAKRETKRATATTTQMIGRINLRVIGDKVALHSIKVQQPKQVKVDSADNHDRTRKFVWQKSSHIAQVVSQKLASVAQSFLQLPNENEEA